jgi:hypothetical protein
MIVVIMVPTTYLPTAMMRIEKHLKFKKPSGAQEGYPYRYEYPDISSF